MAAATVVKTEYGYYVTGGVDATTIHTGRQHVKAVGFVGADTNDTAALTTTKNITGVVTPFLTLQANGTAGELVVGPEFGEEGVNADNLAVTLSNAAGKLWVYIK